MRRLNVLIYFGVFLTIGSLIFFVTSRYNILKSELEKELEQGQIMMESGSEKSLQKALKIFATIASEANDNSQEKKKALFYIAEIYEKLKMPELARSKYIKLLSQIDSGNKVSLKERLQFKIAKMQIMTIYKDEALIRLLLLAKDVQDNNFLSEIYTELGHLYLISRDVNKALTSLKIALKKNPDNVEAIKLLSKINNISVQDCNKKSKTANCNKALVTLQQSKKILKKKSVDPKAILKIAFGYYGQHHYKKAIEYFHKITSCCSNTPEEEIAWFYIGSAHAVLKEYDNAIKAHTKVVNNSITARDQLSFIRIGQLYFNKGNYAKAIHFFSLSKRRYPNGKYIKIASEWKIEAEKSESDKEQYDRL